jgi:hypothetical protein
VELHVIPRAVFRGGRTQTRHFTRSLSGPSRQLDEARELLLTVGRKSVRERVATLLRHSLAARCCRSRTKIVSSSFT